MKTITVRDLQKKIRQCVDLSQRDHVVVTHHGRPAAIVIGVAITNSPNCLRRRNSRHRPRTHRRRQMRSPKSRRNC